MVEITLKRRARAFAEKYDVSYTHALAAVDEPLHRLRDEIQSTHFARPGFQLTDSEEELLDPVKEENAESLFADYTRTLRNTSIRPFAGPSSRWKAELLGELSRRMGIFADAKVRDILEYRSLYRAGLTPEDVDFLPHYYHRFGSFERSLVALGTARYGLIEIAVLQDRFTARQWRDSDGSTYELSIPESQRGSRRLKKITRAELEDFLHPAGS